jgi:hypothetical protein
MEDIHNVLFVQHMLKEAIDRQPRGAQVMIHYPDGSAEFRFTSTDIVSYEYIRDLMNSIPTTLNANVIKPWQVPGLGGGTPRIHHYMNLNDQSDTSVPINEFATQLYEEVHTKQKGASLRGVLVMVWPDE